MSCCCSGSPLGPLVIPTIGAAIAEASVATGTIPAGVGTYQGITGGAFVATTANARWALTAAGGIWTYAAGQPAQQYVVRFAFSGDPSAALTWTGAVALNGDLIGLAAGFTGGAIQEMSGGAGNIKNSVHERIVTVNPGDALRGVVAKTVAGATITVTRAYISVTPVR